MRAVNLLPRPDARRKLPLNSGVLLAGGAPLVAVCLMAGAYVLSSGGLSAKEQTLSGLESELAGLPAPTPPDPANVALTQETGARILAVGSALSDRVAVDRILREISLILPEDVWLSGLTIKSDAEAAGPIAAPAQPASSEAAAPAANGESGAAPEGGAAAEGSAAPATPPTAPEGVPTAETSGFVLIGYTYSQEGVARMLSRLSVLPHLANVQLAESLSVPAGKRTVVQFTVLADLRSSKESS
jgi:Tfp pilus assembly protein PilN